MRNSKELRLENLNNVFLQRIKLLKLPLQERINKYSSDLDFLNKKIEQEIQYFEGNKIDQKIIENKPNLSPELINYLKSKDLIKTYEILYKDPVKPVKKYLNFAENIDQGKTLIQFLQFLKINNIRLANCYELVKNIDDFLRLEIKMSYQKVLTNNNFYELEKEVEKSNAPKVNIVRALRRFLFLNTMNKIPRDKKPLFKNSKVFKLINNYSKEEIENSNLTVPEYILKNGKREFASELLDKDLMRIKLEIGIDQFIFKYFDS